MNICFTPVMQSWIFSSITLVFRPRVYQSVFSPRLAYFFNCWVFFQTPGACRALGIFFAQNVFFSVPKVEECSTLDKTLRSSWSLSSQRTNPSGGGAGLLTVPRPNNNGEVNIVCLRVFIFFTRSNCRTTLIMLWKIMLGETFILRRVSHVSNHSNHSIRCALERSQLSVFSWLKTLWWTRGLSHPSKSFCDADLLL